MRRASQLDNALSMRLKGFIAPGRDLGKEIRYGTRELLRGEVIHVRSADLLASHIIEDE